MEANENQTTLTGDTPAAEPDPTTEYRGTGIMWTAVALIVALVLFVVVTVQNTHDVVFQFLWLDADLPLILIIAITFVVALLIGEAVGFIWRYRRRRRLRDREELRRLRRRTG